ncbi:MAG: hypothetical protein RSD13_03860 [Clostridium sp.]|uniref:hypothetical protein n=1 Tax=Clostridium sp. TaxID=1506 RepID=UPI002FC83185
MQSNSNVFVKLNYKSIGESKSLIIDRQGNFGDSKKYLMCAGKYDKNGWTIVFRAKNFEEAQEIVNNNPFIHSKGYSASMYSDKTFVS